MFETQSPQGIVRREIRGADQTDAIYEEVVRKVKRLTDESLRQSFPSLERLAGIATLAGKAILPFYRTATDAVDQKADASPITPADRAAHTCIMRELLDWDPDIPIISEEATVPSFEERRHWKRFWLVDPLDGTKEFISQNGEFTVNIALVVDGEPVLGVVGAPALDTIYVASRECGSWRSVQGKPFERLTAGTHPHRNGRVRIVESRSHPSGELEAFLAILGPIERIKLGSSLKFCRVAEGEADVYPRFGRTMEWDVAAGDCIYRNSSDGRQRMSPLRYNQLTLSTTQFVIGELPNPSQRPQTDQF